MNEQDPMRDALAYSALLEDLEVAIGHVRGQFEANRSMTERLASRPSGTPADTPDPDVIALGYTIHNYYNAVENYFLRIAKFFENHLDPSTWHRDLVNRMATTIEGLRPNLLTRDDLHHFHELRGFRHVFRSLYDSVLDPDKLALANRHVNPAHQAIQTAHESFTGKLRTIRDAV